MLGQVYAGPKVQPRPDIRGRQAARLRLEPLTVTTPVAKVIRQEFRKAVDDRILGAARGAGQHAGLDLAWARGGRRPGDVGCCGAGRVSACTGRGPGVGHDFGEREMREATRTREEIQERQAHRVIFA